MALGQAGVDGASTATGVRDVQDSRMSLLSRSGLARPNSCILRALTFLDGALHGAGAVGQRQPSGNGLEVAAQPAGE